MAVCEGFCSTLFLDKIDSFLFLIFQQSISLNLKRAPPEAKQGNKGGTLFTYDWWHYYGFLYFILLNLAQPLTPSIRQTFSFVGIIRESLKPDDSNRFLNCGSVRSRPPVMTSISRSSSLAMEGSFPGGITISKTKVLIQVSSPDDSLPK